MKPVIAILACSLLLTACAGVIDRCKDGFFPGEPGQVLPHR